MREGRSGSVNQLVIERHKYWAISLHRDWSDRFCEASTSGEKVSRIALVGAFVAVLCNLVVVSGRDKASDSRDSAACHGSRGDITELDKLRDETITKDSRMCHRVTRQSHFCSTWGQDVARNLA